MPGGINVIIWTLGAVRGMPFSLSSGSCSCRSHIRRSADCDIPQVVEAVPLVDYWVGWITAFYQHETGTPYRRIFEAVPYEQIAASYHLMHEASEFKFIDVFRPRIAVGPTRLALQRKVMRLSQGELADLSGVGLRSIQMYEQKNKNINHASSETLLRLSRVLRCSMEDLMEL